MVTINDRFEINAALERLLDDGGSFDPEDARVLIEKVPVAHKGNEFVFRYEDHTPDKGVEGYTPEIGNVRIGDDKPRVKEVGLRPDVTRVGGYKLVHRPGSILVEVMWADTKVDLATGQKAAESAMLLYGRRSKQPLVLKRSVMGTLRLVFWPKPLKAFTLHFVRYVAWKRPSSPGGLGDVATGSGTLPKATRRERGQTSDFGVLGAQGCASLQAAN
ncbi:hypothetical protein BHAOGJBA_4456 [Methylobacterium hispanicum]|uniref:Restriction endonuclease domain-containing protein n=1 Tax=Methylobacterium hispanicum TaxID=270350 RepID=A0AAV4ZRU0_9HYPH|nr:hypothetical protein [Methylobacterium hispanicum]GJD90912.1 hypothetical protein BHAOGJBA_4456 [Methylobacterium hispanicum]